MRIKVGDFILTQDNRMLEVIGNDMYGVTAIFMLSDGTTMSRNHLKHLGKLIPREEVTKSMEVLYIKQLT